MTPVSFSANHPPVNPVQFGGWYASQPKAFFGKSYADTNKYTNNLGNPHAPTFGMSWVA